MILRLFKIQLASLTKQILRQGNTKVKKQKPIMIVLITLLVVYVISSVTLSLGMLFYKLASGLIPMGLGQVYFTLIGIVTFGSTIIFCIFMAQSMLFDAKDNNLLLSLPVKPSDILLSRILVLGAFEFITSLLFLLPAAAVYASIAKPEIWFYPIFLFASALLTLLALTAVALFGYFVLLITKRMRNKSLFITIISLALLVTFYWGGYSLTKNMTFFITQGASIGDAIKNTLPPFYYFGTLLIKMDIGSTLIFTLWCVIPFGMVCLWLSKMFFALATTNYQAKKLVYKDVKLQGGSAYTALLKKEMKKFLSTPAYLLNCGLAFIMDIAFGVYIFVSGPRAIENLKVAEQIQQIDNYLLPVIIALMCFFAAMAYTTAPSISLEGKNLWILKSSPINVRDIFHAKISLNLIFGVATLLFTDACLITKLRPTLAEALVIIFVPISVQIFTALGGLICNLLYPKFDAVNDTLVIKQSSSVLLSTLISFGTLALIIGSFVLLIPVGISLPLFGLCVVVGLGILNVAAYKFIMSKGTKLFDSY